MILDYYTKFNITNYDTLFAAQELDAIEDEIKCLRTNPDLCVSVIDGLLGRESKV